MDVPRVIQVLSRGVVAAVVGGVLAGLVMRVLMRAMALVAGAPGPFTLGGTVFIVLAHVLPLLPGAVALAASGRRWPWVLLGLGMAWLLFVAVTIGVQDIAAATLTWTRVIGVALVALLMLGVYVTLPFGVYRIARPRRQQVAVPV
jgi:hypothetical protein